MDRRPTLVCCAMPFGYGPAAKLLRLAADLRHDLDLVFVGRGVALDLVARGPDAFVAVLEGDVRAPTFRPLLERAAGVLSLMDREAGAAAAAAGRPLFVLDSLLWMRPRVPPPLAGAARYWAQAFPGLDAAAYEPRPVVVGPVLGPAPPPAPRREGLVVHLGGSAAPDGRGALYEAYARGVLEAVRDAHLVDRFGTVDVLGGPSATHAADVVAHDARVRVSSLPAAEARARMAAASAVLTAPGLTATLACLEDATPTWFLPPQNRSQWLVLATLREHGLGVAELAWADAPDAPDVRRAAEPSDVDPLVLAAIARGLADPGFPGRLAERLVSVGVDADARRSAGRRLLAMLGPPGADTVVAGIRRAVLGAGAATGPGDPPRGPGGPR